MGADDGIRERIAEYFERQGAPLKAQWVREGHLHEIYMADVIALVREALDEE